MLYRLRACVFCSTFSPAHSITANDSLKLIIRLRTRIRFTQTPLEGAFVHKNVPKQLNLCTRTHVLVINIVTCTMYVRSDRTVDIVSRYVDLRVRRVSVFLLIFFFFYHSSKLSATKSYTFTCTIPYRNFRWLRLTRTVERYIDQRFDEIVRREPSMNSIVVDRVVVIKNENSSCISCAV